MADLEKIVWVSPAYDERSDEPKKNYGIGSCRITFVLKGSKGAVQFLIGTDWHVPASREHLLSFPHTHENFRKGDFFKPDGWDVGYHSPKPMYEEQTSMDGECELVEGGKCYYDGSGLRADDWIEDFVAGGTKWLWPKLEEEYLSVFESEAKADGVGELLRRVLEQ